MVSHEIRTVFTTRDVMMAQMARMALNEADIRCEIENEHQAGLAGVLDMKVNVPADDEARAKQVIGELEAAQQEEYQLVVVSFDGKTTAEEAQLALRKLEKAHLIDIDDSVVVLRNSLGKVEIKQSHNLTADGVFAGGLCGAIVGTLCMSPLIGLVAGAATGAVAGALEDIGVDDGFLKQLGDSLKPSSSALAVLVRRADPEKVLAELRTFKGEVLRTTLSHADEARLRDALNTN